MQLVVFADGSAGFNIEVRSTVRHCARGGGGGSALLYQVSDPAAPAPAHSEQHSPTDGMITQRMAEFVVRRCRELPPLDSVSRGAPVQPLRFNLPAHVADLCWQSKKVISDLGLSFSLQVRGGICVLAPAESRCSCPSASASFSACLGYPPVCVCSHGLMLFSPCSSAGRHHSRCCLVRSARRSW